MSKTRTTSTTTISSAEAAYSDLASGSYELSGGTSTGTIQARILCQPAGSSVYYQDTRLASGVLNIDMTRTVQYT